MKTLHILALTLGLTLPVCGHAATKSSQPPPDTEPLPLDLDPFYKVRFDPFKPKALFAAMAGWQEVDGLPFEIGGEAILFGKTQAERNSRVTYPKIFPDIQVGRKFDELHLIHIVKWWDLEGQAIATIRLNYADGTKHEFPILYGGHVRDGQRLATEEKELLTDPGSKIFWRGPGVANLKSTSRLFKSLLKNPNPQKVVATLDVVSTESRGAYSLLAATVALSDAARPVSPPVEADEPERNFDGKLTVRVVDKATHKPIAGALIEPGMVVDNVGLVAGQFRTSATGEGIIRFPLERTSQITISASKEGGGREYFGARVDANLPKEIEIELTPPRTITGVVRRPDGRPAAGLPVRLVGNSSSDREGVETDANGRLTVELDRQRYEPEDASYCLLIRDPARNLAVAQDIDEDSGALDLRLAPALTLVGRAECDGKPIPRATAALVFWTGNRGTHLEGMVTGTNTPGHFEIPALPLGRKYGLYVSAPGYGQKFVNAAEADADAKRIELDPVELKLANLKLAGKVLDADDQPVTNAYVYLSGDGQPNANVRTDRQGKFRFDHVCAGSIQLHASAQSSHGNIMVEGGDTDVVLRLGENYATFSGGKPLRLTGTVTGLDGKPAAGAQVGVFPYNGSRWIKTGADGTYRLDWNHQSYQRGDSLLVVRDTARNLAAAVELTEDATNLNAQLKPALVLEGRVEDAAGAPLAKAEAGVWLKAGNSYDQLDDHFATTDPQGHFAIKGLPADAHYLVFAKAKGYSQIQQPFESDLETNRLVLPPFVLRLADKVLSGQVVNSDDKPVSGVQISVSGEDQPQDSATSDSKGRFSLKVCEGQVRLFAHSQSGFAQATAEAGDTNVVLQVSRNAASIRTAPKRSTLKGKPLPDLTAMGFAAEAVPADRPLLLCLFDLDQRPSRRCVRLLAEQHDALRQKGLSVLALQAAATSADSLKEWKGSNPVPFPVGSVTEKSEKTKWATGIESFPWLILTDAKGRVTAEGFPLEELETKLQGVGK